jgi:hemoglobin
MDGPPGRLTDLPQFEEVLLRDRRCVAHARHLREELIGEHFYRRAKKMQELEVYSMIGTGGFTRLVAAFYRQVPEDDLLGPMYPATDLPGAEQRLRDFLIGRFGGPQTYIEQRGHPRLRGRHSPFHINQAARDRWMRLMNSAVGEAALPAEAEQVLRKFFDGMSSFMINRVEP